MGCETGRGLWWRSLVGVTLVCLSLALVAPPAHAELDAGASADESGFWKDVGLGAGAAFANILYIPAKIVYASVGGVVGGLAYVVTLGSTETANAIWEPTLGGTYVLTPKILAGEERLQFNGQPPMPPVPEPRSQDTSYREYDAGGWDQQ